MAYVYTVFRSNSKTRCILVGWTRKWKRGFFVRWIPRKWKCDFFRWILRKWKRGFFLGGFSGSNLTCKKKPHFRIGHSMRRFKVRFPSLRRTLKRSRSPLKRTFFSLNGKCRFEHRIRRVLLLSFDRGNVDYSYTFFVSRGISPTRGWI